MKDGKKGSRSRRRSKKQATLIVDLTSCKYEVLRIVLKKNGWENRIDDEKNCHLIWTGMYMQFHCDGLGVQKMS